MQSLALIGILTVAVVLPIPQPNSTTPSSHSLAAQLIKRLGDKEPRALAAQVPDDDSRFVAVLHMPGNQLLAVSATYSAPSLLREQIVKNEHRQVYMDLNSAADLEGRFFVFDLGEPGLASSRRGTDPFDLTWRNGLTRTLYDGAWQEQKLSEDDYRERFKKDEAEYVNLLRILLATEAWEERR